VNDGRKGGEVDGQRDGGNGGDGAGEGLEELLLADVQNGGREGVARIVDLRNAQTVGEGGDVEHVEESSLGGTDLVAGLDELQVGGDFNGTTGDLGGNTESLEERGLARFHTSVAGRDPDIGGGNGTSTSRGSDLVGQNLVTDILEVTVGEDKADIAPDVGKELLVLGDIGNEGLQSSADLEFGRKISSTTSNAFMGLILAIP